MGMGGRGDVGMEKKARERIGERDRDTDYQTWDILVELNTKSQRHQDTNIL
jgi:hypothetical protein